MKVCTFLEVFLFHSIMRVYFLLISVVALVTALDDVSSQQQNYGDRVGQNGGVIDKIFNIPITAVKQSAIVAKSFTPENKEMIDNVFQIPISTLEAVGDLVKSTTAQRRENADEIQKRRQDRRDRIIIQREEQKLRREQLQNERLQRKSLRYPRHQKNPWELNSLTKILIGHHGSHEIVNGNGNGHGSNSYQVHEEVDEGNQSTGTFFGHFSLNPSKDQIHNKIAPSKPLNNYPILDKFSTTRKDRSRYRYDEPPLENKIAPRNSRITFV